MPHMNPGPGNALNTRATRLLIPALLLRIEGRLSRRLGRDLPMLSWLALAADKSHPHDLLVLWWVCPHLGLPHCC